jgi:hypothetical protein
MIWVFAAMTALSFLKKQRSFLLSVLKRMKKISARFSR